MSSDAAIIRIVRAALDAAGSLLQVDKLGEDSEHLQQQFQPNAIIVDSDSRSGVRTAFEHITDARRHFPAVPVIAMGNEMSAQLVLAALRAGAADFVDREASAEQLQLSIETCVERGGGARAQGRSRVAAILSGIPGEQDQDFALNLAVRAAKTGAGGKRAVYRPVAARLPGRRRPGHWICGSASAKRCARSPAWTRRCWKAPWPAIRAPAFM